MATIQAMYQPHSNKPTDWTPGRVDYLVTSGSGATDGGMEVFADATATDDFFLTNLEISFLNPTAGALFSTYIGTKKVATYPTLASATPVHYSHSFPIGASGSQTTTTATVSIVGDGANTATVQFYAVGYRKK